MYNRYVDFLNFFLKCVHHKNVYAINQVGAEMSARKDPSLHTHPVSDRDKFNICFIKQSIFINWRLLLCF